MSINSFLFFPGTMMEVITSIFNGAASPVSEDENSNTNEADKEIAAYIEEEVFISDSSSEYEDSKIDTNQKRAASKEKELFLSISSTADKEQDTNKTNERSSVDFWADFWNEFSLPLTAMLLFLALGILMKAYLAFKGDYEL